MPCNARLFLDNATKKCTRKTEEQATHSHMYNQQALCDEIAVSDKIKQDVSTFSSMTPGLQVSAIFNQTVREQNDLTLNFATMSRNLYRIRSQSMPPSPKTAVEVERHYRDKKTMNDFGTSLFTNDEIPTLPTKFYRCVHKCDSFSYCIFASPSIIYHIEREIDVKRRNYLLDATFKVVPLGEFNQLLIIHIALPFVEKTVPFIFVLMSRKTQECYRHLFENIDRNIFSLRCNSFTTDFEHAMRNALKVIFPTADFCTCWFHYRQAIRRHAIAIPKFVEKIQANPAFMEIYGKLLCLPLLPAKMINGTFNVIKAEAKSIDAKLFRRFLKYFERQWIQQEGATSISVYRKTTRTNNAVEAYNGHLGRRIPAKGHFFRFAVILLDEEDAKARDFHIAIKTAGASSQSSDQRRKYADRNIRILAATDLLDANKLTPMEFLRRVIFHNTKLEADVVRLDCVGANSDDDISVELSKDPDASEFDRNLNDPPPSKRTRRSKKEEDVCSVCWDAKPRVMVMPCRQMCLCEKCFSVLKGQAAKRAKIPIDSDQLQIRCPMCGKLAVANEALRCFVSSRAQ